MTGVELGKFGYKVARDFGLYIIVGLLIFFGLKMRVSNENIIKRNADHEATVKVLIDKIDNLRVKTEALNKKLGETEVKKEEIRMDLGKTIREFNREVKEIKKYEDPKESYEALGRAWDN